MSAIVFIGDELTVAGFRLTGIETLAPAPDRTAAVFADAIRRARLVIITAGLSRHVPPGDLDAATASETSVVAIVPDVLLRALPPDLPRWLRSILGIEK